MAKLAQILVGLFALFFLAMGLLFWFSLDSQAAGFAVAPDNILGRASIRADFGGFFLTGGLLAAYAALKRHGGAALVGALMLMLALTGRIISLLLDGPAPGGISPMVVELVSATLLLWARSVWAKAG